MKATGYEIEVRKILVESEQQALEQVSKDVPDNLKKFFAAKAKR